MAQTATGGFGQTLKMRTFDTGATRDTDSDKPDFDGFLSPLALEAFAEYMHRHRQVADGSLRASDNWQKGMPLDEYRKSAWRHFFAFWKTSRDPKFDHDSVATVDAACGVLFNIMGYLHEALRDRS